jgi:hypothetical protein
MPAEYTRYADVLACLTGVLLSAHIVAGVLAAGPDRERAAREVWRSPWFAAAVACSLSAAALSVLAWRPAAPARALTGASVPAPGFPETHAAPPDLAEAR